MVHLLFNFKEKIMPRRMHGEHRVPELNKSHLQVLREGFERLSHGIARLWIQEILDQGTIPSLARFLEIASGINNTARLKSVSYVLRLLNQELYDAHIPYRFRINAQKFPTRPLLFSLD